MEISRFFIDLTNYDCGDFDSNWVDSGCFSVSDGIVSTASTFMKILYTSFARKRIRRGLDLWKISMIRLSVL